MKPRIIVAAMFMLMCFAGAANADTYWLGPFQAEGIGVTEADAAADAFDVLEQYVEDMDSSLVGGESVIAYSVGSWDYDGLTYTITFHVFIGSNPL